MLLALALFAGPSPHAAFARCVAATRALRAYSVRVEVLTRAGDAESKAVAELALAQGGARAVTSAAPASAKQAAFDWRFTLAGAKVVGFDEGRRVFTRTRYPDAGKALSALGDALGPVLPLPARLFLGDEGGLAGLFAKFGKVKTWSKRAAKGGATWSTASSGARAEFTFSTSTGLLQSWRAVSRDREEAWRFTYLPHRRIALPAPPAGWVQLAQLRLPPAPRAYPDKGAQAAVRASLAAYERLFRASVDDREADLDLRIWRAGRVVTAQSRRGAWRYDGEVLAAWNGRGLRRGRLAPAYLAATLDRLGQDATPFALALATDANFAGEVFAPGYDARLGGTLGGGPTALKIVQLFGPAVRVDLEVDGDGLIRRVDSTAYDRRGKPLSEDVRTFAYGAPGAAPQPPARAAGPLPKLSP